MNWARGLCLALIGAVPLPVFPADGSASRRSISIQVSLVLVPVTVTDALERPVLGLETAAFRLFEDGVEQPIQYFHSEHAPLSLGIVVDSSGSMKDKIDLARRAVSRMMEHSLPGDEYFLITFASSPHLLTSFTNSPQRIEAALGAVEPEGWTSLLDAVYLGVNEMRKAANARKALLVISDGADNHSRYERTEIRDILRESDVSLYAAGIRGRGLGSADLRLLAGLAEQTGGRMFTAQRASELPEAIEKIDTALRAQYLLGYSPANVRRDGKYRRVQVKLAAPAAARVRLSWRSGYFAPN